LTNAVYLNIIQQNYNECNAYHAAYNEFSEYQIMVDCSYLSELPSACMLNVCLVTNYQNYELILSPYCSASDYTLIYTDISYTYNLLFTSYSFKRN